MQEVIVAFLADPNPATYQALRKAVTASPSYRPEAQAPDVWDLLDKGDLEQAAALVKRSLPNFLLSPATHVAQAVLWDKHGDARAAQLEFYFADKLREALLATGDGTEERPYEVARVSDEFGILSWLKLTPQRFDMAFSGGRLLDALDTQEGRCVFFDVALPFEAYGRPGETGP